MATKEEMQNLASANHSNYPNTPNLESHQADYNERQAYNDRLAEDRKRAEDARKK